MGNVFVNSLQITTYL